MAENPQCWCQTCRPITMSDMRMVLCPACGNKRCPRATNHIFACTGSNEPGQHGSAYGIPYAPTPPAQAANAEPVAVLRFDRGTPGRENEMPTVVSCVWLPDGEYEVYTAPVAAQAPQEPDEPLPPPGIHAAVHYAGWLRREAHRHQEPKAGALRQAARMLDVLNAECGRLHQELIDAQALQQDADPCPQCIPGGVCKTPTCGRLLAAQAPAAGGDAERVRNAAEILDTLTSNLVAGHPLRVKAAEGAKRAVADLYGVADQIDAAMRKEGRGDE